MTELQDHLAAYLRGESSLREFEEWFLPATWDAQDVDDPLLENARNMIDARIAEFTNGDWDEEELKDFLRPLVETKHVPLAANTDGMEPPRSANESSVRRISLDFMVPRGMGPLLMAPNPQILASRPDALNEKPERNARNTLVLEA